MITGKNKDLTLPGNDAFITWVKRSIADLDMNYSDFLRDEGVPGSVNRVSKILRNPVALRLSVAVRLEAEIRAAARKKAISLLPLEVGSFSGMQET